jgi:hypothetical protein
MLHKKILRNGEELKLYHEKTTPHTQIGDFMIAVPESGKNLTVKRKQMSVLFQG